ncbi:MAG: RNA polymerase sigma factor [Solirubrobacteraceae bacterium]
MDAVFASADDATLLAASANGERAAFAVFYRRHLPPVVAVLARETRDRELAADLAAEVFAAALIGAGGYRPQHVSALPWLVAIARNKAADSVRRGQAESRARRRLGMSREPVDDADLERVDELAGRGERLLGLVSQLPDEQRAAVRARVIDELEYDEIALMTGASEQALRQRVSRALARLRRQSQESSR